jgi:micrococcal nuclease
MAVTVLLVWLVAALGGQVSYPEQFEGRCLSVQDGDTIGVDYHGLEVRIRLQGIDAPERNQPFHTQSKKFLSRLVFQKNVRVRARGDGGFGRLLGEVRVDGKDVSVELLKAGLARHNTRYSSDPVLAGLEAEARKARVGIWSLVRKAAPPRAVTPDTTPAAPYRGNVRSRVFHQAGCEAYDCRRCTRQFTSRDEALSSGFRPCKLCKP